MPNGLIIASMLVPTLGHKYLIDFANAFISEKSEGDLYVLICSRDCEPTSGIDRINALKKTYNNGERIHFVNFHGNVPQNPEDDPDFWNVWRDIVRAQTRNQPGDYVFASEKYGENLAKILGCKFVPCNLNRDIIPITGTQVRQDLLNNFHYVLPQFQKNIRKIVTLFGAESTGKTTMAKVLSEELPGQFVSEWAREYLENFGHEVTDEKMNLITEAQYALQIAAWKIPDKPFVFQDTDLYSTLGYFKIYNGTPTKRVQYLCEKTESHMYIIMNDQIPFTQDILRYGGKVRESNTKFWVDLLEDYACDYYVVKATDHEEQVNEIKEFLWNWFEDETKKIREFVRN